MNHELLDPVRPRRYLAACPDYVVSPLRRYSLDGRPFQVKDETARMGLGAFKALGGVYAVAALIGQATGVADEPENLQRDDVRARAAEMTFVCASAGNHGMAVAAGAKLFGAGCRIHLAATVPDGFEERLRAKGADVVRSGETYEESVAAAIADAAATGAVHLADGSWPQYTEPPRLVMEGYTVIAEELRESYERSGDWPARVYLQAGVGGLAGAMAFMIRRNWTVQPEIVVVEPDAAPCLAESVKAGAIVTVEGPVSNMGRLDCKTPSMLALEILTETTDRFMTVTDEEAAAAAGRAAALGLPTTPSGAAGLAAMLREPAAPGDALVILSEGAVTG